MRSPNTISVPVFTFNSRGKANDDENKQKKILEWETLHVLSRLLTGKFYSHFLLCSAQHEQTHVQTKRTTT